MQGVAPAKANAATLHRSQFADFIAAFAFTPYNQGVE
jgi:hypothetical protein